MAKTQKVPVSRRATEQRVKRALDRRGDKLVADQSAAGRYYVVDGDKGRVLDSGRTLLALAKEFGVLKAFEEMVE